MSSSLIWSLFFCFFLPLEFIETFWAKAEDGGEGGVVTVRQATARCTPQRQPKTASGGRAAPPAARSPMGEAPQRAAKPAKAARRKKRAAEECLVFECLKPRYDAFKKVGNGSYGVVCSAVDAQDAGARRVAIKRVSPWADDCWDARHTLRELRLMHLLRGHPNVISLHDAVLRPGGSDDLFIVMELMDSDLHRVVSSKQARGPRRGSRHTGRPRGRRGGGAVDARPPRRS